MRLLPRILPSAAVLAAVVASALSCGSSYKARRLRLETPGVDIAIPGASLAARDTAGMGSVDFMPQADTLVVYDVNGRELVFTEAVVDEETGESMASVNLAAAVVTARFRNVAERHGEVDLAFEVRVPRALAEREWQTRFYPRLSMLGREQDLDMVILTGREYRRSQLRGYQRYNRFVASIVEDSTRFINIGALEKFIQRNIPALWAFRSDSSGVSEEEFEGAFGVTERQAIDHYTDWLAVHYNDRRRSRMGAVYRHYVKAPIITDGVRLDTVFTDVTGDFVYEYVQTVRTEPGLRKAEITLSGEIFEQDMLVYTVPPCEPLTFYISSLSSLADPTSRYLTRVVSRRAEANTACRLEFRPGRWEVDASLGNNASEIDRIGRNLRSIILNQTFDLDSISVCAWASPEGSDAQNRRLCDRRAESAVRYFRPVVRYYLDSLRSLREYVVVAGDDMHASGMQSVAAADWQEVDFRCSAGGENWEMLDGLVRSDSLLAPAQVEAYFSHASLPNDAREAAMARDGSYRHLRGDLYPLLRSVDFRFYLHRKGMVQDTMLTTELDSVYMRGVQAIDDRDYKLACALLDPYQDFNTAVACMADDRNVTALQILEPMERTAPVNYMLAILYSRLGDERRAVQHYVLACGQQRSYVSRGNLDPEISALIKKYDLNREDDDGW